MSEVLRIISSSPGELEPVFQAMLENGNAHLQTATADVLKVISRSACLDGALVGIAEPDS